MQKYFRSSVFVWALFVLSPFLSLLYSLKRYRSAWAKNVLWAFIIFYGFSFVIYDEFIDANRYAENLETLYNTQPNINDISTFFISDGESTYLDIAGPLITFLVSCFTKNSSVLFGVYAMVYGFFYSRNLWFLLERANDRISIFSFIIILIISLMIPFWAINGFRFWTASQVFLYGFLPWIFSERKSRYLSISFLSVFFHFSFIIPLGIVLLSFFQTKKVAILYYVFIASFLVNMIELQSLQGVLLQVTPSILHKKLTTYVNNDYAEHVATVKESFAWFVLLKGDAIKFLALALISVTFYVYKNILKNNEVLFNAFCFILHFSAVSNILSAIPSVGRFQTIGYYLVFSFSFLMLQNYYKELLWIRRTIFIFLPLITLIVVFQFRVGFQTINTLTVIGNPIVRMVDPGQSLLNIFKK